MTIHIRMEIGKMIFVNFLLSVIVIVTFHFGWQDSLTFKIGAGIYLLVLFGTAVQIINFSWWTGEVQRLSRFPHGQKGQKLDQYWRDSKTAEKVQSVYGNR